MRIVVLTTLLTALPLVASAQGGFVKCGNSDIGVIPSKPCTFEDFADMIQTVFDWVVFNLVTPLVVLLFAYAGWLRFWNKDDPMKQKESNKIFTNVALSYALLLSATLIVKLLFSVFFGDSVPSLIG